VEVEGHNFGLKPKIKKPVEVVREVGEVGTTDIWYNKDNLHYFKEQHLE
tara:strand:- start:756 stop:902 length:147 start_codon:yes stop_codon:yes gene_type:complete